MLIIWRYLKDNFIFISFHLLCIPFIIFAFDIFKDNNILIFIKISSIIICIIVIIMLLILSYKDDDFKADLSIKDLIKLNSNKKFQYQKLIKEEKYHYTGYITHINKDTQLKIYNELNKYTNDLYVVMYRQEKYLKKLINPCYEIIQKIVEEDPDRFKLINKKCNNYKEYEELYKFMTI